MVNVILAGGGKSFGLYHGGGGQVTVASSGTYFHLDFKIPNVCNV